ncbi:hypothetical protein KR018_007787 [Drosophila ironensis]|nr:hypothetical protein KR018_007787 [Drosophila ironensis]
MEARAIIWGIVLATFFSTNPLTIEAAQTGMLNLSSELKGFNCRNESVGGLINLTAVSIFGLKCTHKKITNHRLGQLSGYWYEAARVPNLAVLECLNVSVPDASDDNNELSLLLNYIDTTNGGRSFTNQTIEFPWNNSTQNGIFTLEYEHVTVTYKLVGTFYNQVALVCGYGSISPVPLFKLFTRQRQISQEIIALVDAIAQELDAANITDMISWQDQSLGNCNGSGSLAPLAFLIAVITVFLLS